MDRRTVVANDGQFITKLSDHTFLCSDGSGYRMVSGNNLMGPNGLVARNVKNDDEARGIILGMHGGRKF